jgi:hypothetical protein
MKKAVLLTLLISACAPVNEQAWMEREVNACVPTAIAFREGLRKYNVWSEVLLAYWNDGKPRGHALVAYLYPPGKNKLWTYDAWGSCRTYAYTNNPVQVAQNALKSRGNSSPIMAAYYLQ